MNKLIFLFRILALLAALILSPAAFSQQDSIAPLNPDRGPDSPQTCVVFVTGDFESECILPLEKPESYINEEGIALIACQGGTVTYTAHLAGNATAVAWNWYVTGSVTWIDHDDGSITVHWGNGDTGFISVDVTDNDGNICSVERTVLLMERPTAIVTTIPPYVVEDGRNIVYVCRGESVEFIDESTLENGDLAGYYWHSGWNGATASSQNFIVNDVVEKQEVSHRVYNNCGCYDSVLFEIRVRDGKPLELGCYGTVCAEQEVTYTAISPECDIYAWYVEGGSIVGDHSSPSVTVHWDNPSSGYGIIGIEGSLCSDYACPALMTKKIPILINSLAITGQRTVCVGEAVEYSLPLYGSTEYQWFISPSDGVIIHDVQANRRVLEFRREGSYQIYVNYNCDFLDCDSLHSDTLTVYVKPRLALGGDSRICKGSHCNIHTLPAGTVAEWTVRDSIGSVLYTGTGDTLLYQFDTLPAGKYRITAENDTFCHSADYILTIVEAPPAPVAIGNSNPTIACPYSSILLTGETDNPAYSLVWKPVCEDASPQSVSGNVVTINYADTVCDVRVFNYDRISGCLSTECYIHHVNQFQLAEMNINPNVTVCPGSLLGFSAPQQDEVIYEWQLEREKQYCASMQGDVYNHTDTLLVNELTGVGVYPTTFHLMLYRTYCSHIKDTTFIAITIDTIHTEVSIDPIDPVCQGSSVNLSGSCEGETITWGVSGCEYYTLSDNQVVFDEPGVFTVTMSCNPYDVCENQRYINTASTTVEVVPLPPFADIAYIDGYVTTVPPLSDEEYSYSWNPTAPNSHIVPATPGATVYSCVVSRRDPLNCSRTLEAVVDTSCRLTEVVCNGYDYCHHTATFTIPDVPAGTQVRWRILGGEYDGSDHIITDNPELTIPFERLGDYLVRAHVNGNPCLSGSCVLTVDFIPEFSFVNRCNQIEVLNNSRTLTGTGLVTLNCNGMLWSFPVTQRLYLSDPLPDGDYTVSLVAYNGQELPCEPHSLQISNTSGATLSIATEFGDQQACDNTAMKVVVTATPPTTISSVYWTVCDGSAITTSSDHFYHTFRENQNIYQVTATLTDDNGCLSYGSTNISSTHNELKEPDLQNVGDPVCPGNSKRIHYTTDHGDIEQLQADYLWNWIVYTSSNDYNVYSTGDYHVTATNSNHCKAMAMTNVRFKNSPQAAIVTDGHIFCVGDKIQFYGSPDPNPENYDFVWRIQRNGSVVDSSVNHNMEYTPSQPGTYTVSLSVTNSEDCSDSDSYSFTVNPRPSRPRIDFSGNRCIHTPPVNLAGSDYSGELHWSNGHVGNTANYYVSGTATAWYYDAETGCRSNDANIYITPAPNFDALLTGCYNICKRDLPNLSPLRVWGLMPLYHDYRWYWLLNEHEIGNSDHLDNPLELQLPEFGDYQLVVAYNDDHCKVKSPFLTLRDSCNCLSVTTRVNTAQIKKCKVHYNLHVTVCNNSDETACLNNPPVLMDNSGDIEIVQTNFHARTLGPGDCYTFLVKLVATNIGGGSVAFRIYDDCNGCDTMFTVDLSEIKIGCEDEMRMDKFRLVPHASTQTMLWFNFHAFFNPMQTVLYFWAEPDIVADYDFHPNSDVIGVASINADTLLRMASNDEFVCFYAIVCDGKKLCKLHYCIHAKELYSLLMRSRSEGAKGAGQHSTGTAESQPSSDGERLTLCPNPANGIVTVTGQSGKVTDVVVLDMQGRRAAAFVNTDSFDVSGLPKGQYIVRVTTDGDDANTHYLKLVKK